MDMIPAIFLFSIAVSSTFAKNDLPSIYGMQRLAIHANNETKLRLVRSLEDHPSFDFARVPVSDEDAVEVMVEAKAVEDFKTSLKEGNVRFEVVNEDVSKLIADPIRLRAGFWWENSPKQFLHSFPRYSEIKTYLLELQKKHPGIAKLYRIGKSSENRELVVIRISSGGNGSKPALFIDAGIHAREWMAPATALYTIKQLVENPANHRIFKDIDIYIVPLLNPDGYEYTHKGPQTRLWRKTRSRQSLNCMGVDGNRNFGSKWMIVGASSNPCSQTYAGRRAFSEPETQALRDFLLTFKDRIRVYLSLHSYGQYILYPYGWTTKLPKNEPTLKCVAMEAERELSKVRGTRYTIGSSSNTLYPASGGSDDWAMDAGIELAYTIELPGGYYGFAPPASEIEPVGRETFEAIKVFARYVSNESTCDLSKRLYFY